MLQTIERTDMADFLWFAARADATRSALGTSRDYLTEVATDRDNYWTPGAFAAHLLFIHACERRQLSALKSDARRYLATVRPL